MFYVILGSRGAQAKLSRLPCPFQGRLSSGKESWEHLGLGGQSSSPSGSQPALILGRACLGQWPVLGTSACAGASRTSRPELGKGSG